MKYFCGKRSGKKFGDFLAFYIKKRPSRHPFLQDVQLSLTWLGRSDLNTRMTESESVALPLGDAPIDSAADTSYALTGCRCTRICKQQVNPYGSAPMLNYYIRQVAKIQAFLRQVCKFLQKNYGSTLQQFKILP